jgi:hypothetical protein
LADQDEGDDDEGEEDVEVEIGAPPYTRTEVDPRPGTSLSEPSPTSSGATTPTNLADVPIPLFIPSPEFKPEQVEYIDGFGAKLSRSSIEVIDEGNEDEEPFSWFSWRRGKGSGRSASGRLRWEDERETWF